MQTRQETWETENRQLVTVFTLGLISFNRVQRYRVVALSSTESKYRALSQTPPELAWLQSLFAEIGINLFGTTIIWCNNLSPAPLASNAMFHGRTKHIELDVREIIVASKTLKI